MDHARGRNGASDAFLIVLNTGAGTAERARVDAAADVLRGAGRVDVAETADIPALDEAVGALDGRTLVVAGGDGSMHAAVAALRRSGALGSTDIGLLPLGTGNDLATGLSIPDDPVAAAEVVLAGHVKPLDLLTTDLGEVVVNASHAGLGATAAGESERFKEALGPAAYPLGALIAGARESGWDVEVTVDGDLVHSGSLLMVGVANAPSIGGGTRLVPPALPDDGLLDVIVVSAVTAAARVAFAVALRDGVHLDRDDVLHVCGTTVTIAGEPMCHDLDGEVTEDRASCTYTVEPAAWRMLLPRAP